MNRNSDNSAVLACLSAAAFCATLGFAAPAHSQACDHGPAAQAAEDARKALEQEAAGDDGNDDVDIIIRNQAAQSQRDRIERKLDCLLREREEAVAPAPVVPWAPELNNEPPTGKLPVGTYEWDPKAHDLVRVDGQ